MKLSTKLFYLLTALAVGCAIVDVVGIQWIIKHYGLFQLIMIPFAVVFGIAMAELTDWFFGLFDKKKK